MEITERMLVNIKWDSPEVAEKVLTDIVDLREMAEKRIGNKNLASMAVSLFARKITVEYQSE